jgi:hypothetical protein
MKGAVVALKEAFVTEATRELKLVEREIEAGYRHTSLPREDGAAGEETRDDYIDIYLFDSVSGGAGLVDLLSEQPEIMVQILDNVEIRLSGQNCVEDTPCQRACIKCLLDFRNAIDHDVMNRIHGYQLLQYLKEGGAPNPDDIGVPFNEDRTPRQDLIERINRIEAALTVETVDSEEITGLESPTGSPIPLMRVSNTDGRSFIIHFYSILSEPGLDNVIPLEMQRDIREVERGMTPDDGIVVLVPFEMARDSPSSFLDLLFPDPHFDNDLDDDEWDEF